jgi:formate hydrogenlyase subunit 3/multisubunit Na+/H+ antiporter MnhD subunit
VTAGWLLAAALATPLAMLAACLSPRARAHVPSLLALAPMPALAAALLAPEGSTLVLPDALLGLTLALDRPGAMLLGASALLWIAAGVYAAAWLRTDANGGRFAVWWVMTLTGSLGVFIAGDLVGFYLFYTLVSLAAYGLVVFDGTASARRAANLYVALALVGEAFLLMGFVFLAAASDGSLLIRDAMAALSASSWRNAALALLLLGFGLKIGLVPLHVWMPLAYSAAPYAAAAVLSGAAVKAGVIGLIRFLPLGTALPGWGDALAAIGLFSAFYGVAIGLTQANPKTVLAYSSVSQMGLLAAVLGMGLAAADESAALAAAFYAVHHVLVKGGLFLALGAVAMTKSRGPWPILLPAAVLALGLGGLPFTGGALAKLAVKAPLGSGAVGLLAQLAAVGSTMLMLHFLHCLMRNSAHDTQVARSTGLVLPWLVTAAAAIVVPWALYPIAAAEPLVDALTPLALWDALWPVLVGGLLAFGLRHWDYRLPQVPQGDILVIGERGTPAIRALGKAMERIEGEMRQWPLAGVLLLALTTILLGTMLAAR